MLPCLDEPQGVRVGGEMVGPALAPSVCLVIDAALSGRCFPLTSTNMQTRAT